MTGPNDFALVPTFRLPVLVHTRTGNAKWLTEIAHGNPVWIHPEDAARIGVASGDLIRVETDIGHYVNRAWVTEGIRPGVVACSHHMGRWRLGDEAGTDRWASARVDLSETPLDTGPGARRTPVAAGGCGAWRACARSPRPTRTRHGSGGATRGPPEPHLPGSSGSDLGRPCLAPEGHGPAGHARGSRR